MSRVSFVLTLGALTAVSPATVDICVPAQPEIAAALGASPAAGATLVSAYLLGFGPGQFLWGPLSDRYGRMLPLYFAISGFVVASIVCATTESFTVLIIARAFQGFMGGGAPVIARAIARDQGGGPKTARLLSTMMVVLGVAPLLAPMVGSGLLAVAEWRVIFWALSLFGVLLIVGTLVFVRGRSAHEVISTVSITRYFAAVVPVLSTRAFLFGTALSTTIFLGYASFLAVGALLAEQRYGISPEAYGPLFAVSAAAFVLGAIVARRVSVRLGQEQLLLIGSIIAAVAAVGMTIFYGRTTIALPLFWAILWVYVFAFGILLPTATAKALEPAGETAGAASSVSGGVGVGAAVIGAELASTQIFNDSYDAVCFMMALSGFSCLATQLLSLALERRARRSAA
jgi:DHA1 family bicyclomycin/chloramphenicol resistance-like MFS transporter